MAILPAFGPGKPVAVRPVGQTGSSKKNWIWYGVGALVGLGVILFLRRGSSTSSTQTGQGTLVSTPNASEQGQIQNLSDAVVALAQQITTIPAGAIGATGPAGPPGAPTVLPNPNTAPPSTPAPAPISSGPVGQIGALQIHAGDSPASLAAYWSRHGFNGITAQGLAASNQGIQFKPGNTWFIYSAGGHP